MRPAIFITLLLLFCGEVQAQVPQTISYQGMLTDNEGSSVADGQYDLTFTLYSSAIGSTGLWSETQAVSVSDGLLNVILGSVEPLDASFSGPYWLGIRIGADAELQPRVQLTAVPYSLSARSVADSSVTSAAIAGGSVTSSKIADGAVVRGLNGLTDDVELLAGENVNLSLDGDAIVISAGGGTGMTSLPFFGTATTDESAFFVMNEGRGNVGTFRSESDLRVNAALQVSATGPGVSMNVFNHGTGTAAHLETSNAENSSPVLTLQQDGLGSAAGINIFGSENTSPAVEISHRGNGAAIAAQNLNGESDQPVLEISTIGSGPALLANTNDGDNIALFTRSGQTKIRMGKDGEVIASGIVQTGQGVVFPDGSLQTSAATSTGSSWSLAGNASTSSESDFLGTTDDQPLELRVNNTRALRIEAVGESDETTVNLIAGGSENIAFEGVVGGTISGGGTADDRNEITGEFGSIGGGLANSANSYATVGGGESNTAADYHSTVGGGENNLAQSVETGGATVSGGSFNQALNDAATVGGGQGNIASGSTSSIAGGRSNQASGQHAAIGGGNENRATDNESTVGGGAQNVASGSAATVPGGEQNHARGDNSFAAGYKARAVHEGSFVWNDRSLTGGNDSLVTTAENQFLVRAAGGVGINTTNPTSQLSVSGTVDADSYQATSTLEDGEPIAGGVYMDNIVYSWADVQADGDAEASFGCSVSRIATGTYTVTYDLELQNGVAPVITPRSFFDPVLAAVATSTSEHVVLRTYLFVEGVFELADSPFFIQVVGRP